MDTPTAARLTLATIRITRAITVDDIGEWWIKDPIDQAMDRYRDTHTHTTPAQWGKLNATAVFDEPWWWKYRDGLDCGWCTSFHVAWLLLAGETLFGRTRAWRGITGALAIAQAAASIGNVLGTYDTGDDD